MANALARVLKIGEGRQLKRYRATVARIGDLEDRYRAMDDGQLALQTAILKERLANGEPEDSLVPEAFATVREASRRVLGMRHYDVQLIGALVLNDGNIAEMRTGEGKTLACVPAGYMNALGGENVHIVTVNDYLAARDSEQMGKVYGFLGMTCGILQNGDDSGHRRAAYRCDATYGTNSEFGFDYLRDNMAGSAAGRVQRGHHYAIVDEVDSILIDEARTPLIISGRGGDAAALYAEFAAAVRGLVRDNDYRLDEAKHTIVETEEGLAKIESRLGLGELYNDVTGRLANHLRQALRAEYMYKRDVDYIVSEGEVKIVDEFTGRVMEGRRWSDGLHQAVEAKEGVEVKQENQTLATVTLQNYFRLYGKLAGMTGTALTEDSEFRDIYKLDVTVIPPNKPVIRRDQPDRVYRTAEAKFAAAADEIAKRHKAGQPVLAGTASVENSELLSSLLSEKGVPHSVLNAKNHRQEARIVAQAGRIGAVTIATNMAGRGTDILLGGNPEALAEDFLAEGGFDPDADPGEQLARMREALDLLASPDPADMARGRELMAELDAEPPAVTAAAREAAEKRAEAVCAEERNIVRSLGGLCVIGTERHESRRIDNQLRGRAGRQGDPGESIFMLSLEDDLLRKYAGDRMAAVASLMEKWDLPDDTPIEAPAVTKAIETAQATIESTNFHARKTVLEYDDVMDLQRKAVYAERDRLLDGKPMTGSLDEIIEDACYRTGAAFCPPGALCDEWDVPSLEAWVAGMCGETGWELDIDACDENALAAAEQAADHLKSRYATQVAEIGPDALGSLANQIMLKIIDSRWMTHLRDMDYLRSGIGLRSLGQRDPLAEYREEAYNAFSEMADEMYEDLVRAILRMRIADGETRGSGGGAAASGSGDAGSARDGGDDPAAGAGGLDKVDPYAGTARTDPCPCGSGRQYRKCHGMHML